MTENTQLRKLQLMEVDMAKVLLDFCKKNEIKIWAGSGTLLGAVRHQGFIPWDDDMDFEMFRVDYEKLKHLAKKNPLQYPYYFDIQRTSISVKREGTTMFPTSIKLPFKRKGNVWIGIGCMDYVPDDITSYEQEWKKMRRIDRIPNNKSVMSFHSSKGLKGKLWHLRCLLGISCLRFGLINNKIKKCKGQRVCNVLQSLRMYENVEKIHKFDKSFFEELIYLKFESLDIPCPQRYDEYLQIMYGDNYMIPQKISSVHGEVRVDLERDYTQVIKEMMAEVPWYKRLMYKY